MARLSRNGSALIASGGMNLCMRLREKMETYYQKNYVKELSQPEVSTSLDYKNELSPEDKENILKDIYSAIKLFYRIVYEARRK